MFVSVVGSLLCGEVLAQPGETPPAEETTAQKGGDQDQVEMLSEEAFVFFGDKKYTAAAEKFLEAYRLEQIGRLLYNIGYVYDEAGEQTLALDFYRRYVKAPDAEAETKAKAYDRIESLRALVEADTPKKETPPPVQVVVERESSGQAVAGWILLGVGGVAAASSVTTGILAGNKENDFKATDNVNSRRSLRKNGENLALATDVALGLATASILTGIVLLATDSEEVDSSAPQVGVTASGVSFGWSVRF